MAIMIPETPKYFSPASLENVMFESLKLLPDSYYVFHSFRITDISENILNENETDFVIFNKTKGVLCIEAKAGAIRYELGEWLYQSGVPMHNGGPFMQAEQNKWKLINYIKSRYNLSDILEKCKFLHCVWFPSIYRKDISKINLPSDGNTKLIITKDDLENPLNKIEEIFDIQVRQNLQTNLNEYEVSKLLNEVFCPSFNIFPTSNLENDIKKIIFHRMLDEQISVLNFLNEQKIVAISGAAGTGKTLIAVEKAERLAHSGTKVLFICFNNQLQEFLNKTYACNGIDFYTISAFACKICGSSVPNYFKLNNEIENQYLCGTFPYQNIIIDEGQDLGRDEIEESGLLNTFKEIVNDSETGSLYIFYDKLQLIQSYLLPKVILEADCKITLFKNCRNTQNIAKTSIKPLNIKFSKMKDGAIAGVPAKLHFCSEKNIVIQNLDETLKNFISSEINDIVILTCKTENDSILTDFIIKEKYKGKYKFTTCRKFKGLEADAVILVDVDIDTFTEENKMIYYVGTSRAKFQLEIFTLMDDEECKTVLYNTLQSKSKNIKNPKRELASALNTNCVLNK